jgi:methyl-accepting chemotaxis protein
MHLKSLLSGICTSRSFKTIVFAGLCCALFLAPIIVHSSPKVIPSQTIDISQAQASNEQLQLDNLALNISARISNMLLIAKSIANDTHIHAWVKQGMPKQVNAGMSEASVLETTLLNKLGFYVDEFDLTSASFADKNSNKYWNHEGFLRVLDPNIDTWYFAYLASQQARLVSIYHDQNKHRVDLYVNFQQIDGNGLSGVASSFNSFLEQLNTHPLAGKGDLLIADANGKVQVHQNILMGEKSLTLDALYSDKQSAAILSKLQNAEIQSDALLSARIDNTDWYLVFVSSDI